MKKNIYVKPEIEIVEIPKLDVLNVSMDSSWTGSGSGDYDWEPIR